MDIMPPHDLDSEFNLLGSIIFSPEIFPRVAAQINGDFYSEKHQIIFDAMRGLHERGAVVEIVALRQELKNSGLLERVGDSTGLVKLTECIGSNWEYHLTKVKDLSARRKAIAKAQATVIKAVDITENFVSDTATLIPPARCLSDYYDLVVDDTATLLGNRWLCREGGALLVGPSGIGKSSAAIQQDAAWGLGRDAFGIKPSKPLRILTIQAENDDADLIEITRGVMDGMRFTAEDRALLREQVIYQRLKAQTGDRFFAVAENLMSTYRPDILRIDPLNGYIGGDPRDVELLSSFCREHLNRLLERYNAAVIINCHTPKTTGRDTTTWKTTDWMYSPAGGADLTNWARAVLVIDPCEEEGLFKFIAAKRGRRIGWMIDNKLVTERHYKHATAAGAIYWDDAAAPASATPKSAADVYSLLGEDERVLRQTLINRAHDIGIAINRARDMIRELEVQGLIHEIKIARPAKKPEVLLSRKPA